MSDQEINGDILRAFVGPDQRDTSRPSEVLPSLTSRYVGISKELLSGLTKRFMEIILELLPGLINSVHRLEMARRAVSCNNWIRVSDWETRWAYFTLHGKLRHTSNVS